MGHVVHMGMLHVDARFSIGRGKCDSLIPQEVVLARNHERRLQVLVIGEMGA